VTSSNTEGAENAASMLTINSGTTLVMSSNTEGAENAASMEHFYHDPNYTNSEKEKEWTQETFEYDVKWYGARFLTEIHTQGCHWFLRLFA
jgi:hypothetical protein